MITRVRVKDQLGMRPGTRRQTAALVANFIQSKVDWVLDFDGVMLLTDEFIDGFFGRIAQDFGPGVFERHLTWINLAHADRVRVEQKIQDALKARQRR